MLFEKSAGAVIFRRDDGKIKYLLLHYYYAGDYWDFSKGNIEKGEDEIEAAAREIKEETGIEDLKFAEDFRQKIHYFYRWKGEPHKGELVSKDVIFFLAETDTKDVKISHEHAGFEWVEFEEARKRLKEQSRKVLERAHKFLKSNLKKFV